MDAKNDKIELLNKKISDLTVGELLKVVEKLAEATNEETGKDEGMTISLYDFVEKSQIEMTKHTRTRILTSLLGLPRTLFIDTEKLTVDLNQLYWHLKRNYFWIEGLGEKSSSVLKEMFRERGMEVL